MTTIELIEQLASKPKNEVEYALFALMAKGKIDFLSVQQAYVKHLEWLKDLNLRQQIEAETCVMESLLYDRIPKNNEAEISTQRRLYLLNQSKRFQMNRLNDKFHYDETRAKTYNHVDNIKIR